MSPSIVLQLFVITILSSSTLSEIVLQSVQSSVGAGNFTYFTVTYDGPISLILESIEGDADLYVSQFTVQPTYEPEKYCLQSASCGIDRVDIPSDYKRPLGVGIYGHPLHPVSTFRLSVVYREALPSDQWTWYDRDFEPDSDLLEEPPSYSEDYNPYNPSEPISSVEAPRSTPSTSQQAEERSLFWTTLWSFLEITIEIFLM